MKTRAPDSLLSKIVTAGLLAIVFFAPTQHGVELVKKSHLTLVDPLVWLTFGLWFISACRSGAGRDIFRVPLLFPLLFVAASALSLLNTPNPLRSAGTVVQNIEYFLAAYLLFASAAADPAKRKLILNMFLVVSALVILLAVSQYAMPGRSDFQVCAAFDNANVMGGFLALVLPLVYGLWLHEQDAERKVACLVVMAGGFGVVLAGGSLLALVVAFAVLSMFRGRFYFAGFAAIFLLGFFLVLPQLPRHNPEVLRQSVALFNDEGAVARRYSEWQAAADMTREHPLIGVGSGCYQDRIGEFYGILPIEGGKAAQPDSQNLFLVLSASIGLPGLACFAGLLLAGMAQAARGYFSAGPAAEKGLYLGAWGSLIAFSINAIWSPLLVRGIGIPLVIILAFAASHETAAPDETKGNG
jgi:O-antigen ligase